MDNKALYLLQELNEAFEAMAKYSLTESEKAAKYINQHKTNIYSSIGARTLRDYWPSKVKSNGEGKGKPIVTSFPRVETLNMIAECAGYKSWAAFKAITLKKVITENTYFDPKDFRVENMKEEDPPIIIGWYPQYFIKLQYLGNYQFQVLSSSYNLKHEYEKDRIIEIYGFEVRYYYEEGVALGLKQEDGETEEEYKERNKGQKYVGGCPLFPELHIFTKPQKEYSLSEENKTFIVRT